VVEVAVKKVFLRVLAAAAVLVACLLGLLYL
jgi:hypothetical protein